MLSNQEFYFCEKWSICAAQKIMMFSNCVVCVTRLRSIRLITSLFIGLQPVYLFFFLRVETILPACLIQSGRDFKWMLTNEHCFTECKVSLHSSTSELQFSLEYLNIITIVCSQEHLQMSALQKPLLLFKAHHTLCVDGMCTYKNGIISHQTAVNLLAAQSTASVIMLYRNWTQKL